MARKDWGNEWWGEMGQGGEWWIIVNDIRGGFCCGGTILWKSMWKTFWERGIEVGKGWVEKGVENLVESVGNGNGYINKEEKVFG